jgi:hypothetical protein
MPYSQFQPTIAPGFLRQPYGAAYNLGLGLIKDLLSDITKQGIQQRFAGLAQAGGLANIGAERGIPQGSGESTATYVANIINAWSAWQLAGTAWSILGLIQSLSPAYGNVYLLAQNGQLFGPASAVVLPNPLLGIAGVPPVVSTTQATLFVPSTTGGDGITWTAVPFGAAGNQIQIVQNAPSGGSSTVAVTQTSGYTLITISPKASETNGGLITAIASSLSSYVRATATGASDAVTSFAQAPLTGGLGSPWTFAIGQGPAGQQGFQYPLTGYWEPSTSYTNATISPNPPNGLVYTMSGTASSGTSAPAWPGAVGATVTDGGITWTCQGSADYVAGSPGYVATPVGQFQGTVRTNFWSAFLLIFSPVPSTWTDVLNPPTISSIPSLYELAAIFALLTKFDAGHSTCAGILLAPTGATRATFGWPTGRTFYGDAGMTSASASNDGLTKFWIPHATVVHGQQCIPTTPNGHWYKATQTGSGVSSYTQPSWPTTTGATVSDGSVTWTCEGATSTYLSGTSTAVTTLAFIESAQL